MTGIRFKDYNDIFLVSSLQNRLHEIFVSVIHEAEKRGWELEVTSVYRSDGGVHSTAPIRGIDLVPVDRDTSKMETIRGWVNAIWDYGKEGFEVCPPIRHGTGPHIHLQSRDETRRIEHAHI